MLPSYFPAPDEKIWIGVLRLQLSFPGSKNLKNKRKELSKIKARLTKSHNISIAEVGNLENIKRSILGICIISNDTLQVESILQRCFQDVSSIIDGRIDDSFHQILPFSSSRDLNAF